MHNDTDAIQLMYVKIRGAWLGMGTIYVLDASENRILSADIPQLSSVLQPPLVSHASPREVLRWRDSPRIPCEIAILSQFQPYNRRQRQLLPITHWGNGGSGMILVDFSDPNEVRVAHDWVNDTDPEIFGVHSGAMQVVDVGGIAIRAGRRFIARLQVGPSGLEVRVLAHSQRSTVSRPSTYNVPLPHDDWDQAEAYDSCTIYGRMLIRQYDSSSDSEHSANENQPKLAVLDFHTHVA